MYQNSSAQMDSIIRDESLVNIDTLDESFVNPLREFFATCNYRVTINHESRHRGIYHIITGDIRFVKSILERNTAATGKRLIIVWNFRDQEITQLPLLPIDRVILNPPPALSSRDVSDFLSFYFGSGRNIKDFGFSWNKEPAVVEHEKKDTGLLHHLDIENFKNFPTLDADQKRINDLLKVAYPKNFDTGKSGRKLSGLHSPASKISFVYRVVSSTVFFFMIPVIWSMASIFISGLSIAGSTQGLITGNISKAKSAITLADFSTETGRTALSFTSLPFSAVGFSDMVRDHERLFTIFSLIIQSTRSSIAIYENSQSLSKNLMPTQDLSTRQRETSIPTTLQKILADISYIKTNISLSTAEINSMTGRATFPFILPGVKNTGSKIASQLGVLNDHISYVEKVLEVYSDISGFSSEKKYLVLLQNSSELRPTGGFIGSVGIVTFHEGVVTAIDIQDVYDIDGQLKGHVDPPPLVHAFLSQEHWYLRDSNWDPDFIQSAGRAAWFYEKSTGTPVDGVIAVNTIFLTDVLRVLGPVEIPDYNEHITADNFFGKSLYYTQNNFFPGSTQKKDFLGSLTRALTKKINSSDPSQGLGLFRVLSNGLAEKNILLYMKDPTVMKRVSEYGWGGEIHKNWGCQPENERSIPCLSDYIYVNEANLGINKVNNFIKKQEARDITLNEVGEIHIAETLSYENQSQNGTDGGGPYTVYARMYIPDDSEILSVTRNGNDLKENTLHVDLRHIPYYYVENQNSFKILNLLFDIAPSSGSTIRIEYKRGERLKLIPNIGTYDLLVQKQPGQSSFPMGITITYPNTWKITQAPAGEQNEVKTLAGLETSVANSGKLEYNGNLTQDERVKIYISN